jgi:hypothetical protein
MEMTGFAERHYRVADGRRVVCDIVPAAGELEALRDALAWRRHELSATELQDADEVLALRALVAVDDRLAETAALGEEAPLSIDRGQASLLCEVSGAYVTARDVEGYQSPEERERIERLRVLSGRLMDACCDLVAAEHEAVEKALLA